MPGKVVKDLYVATSFDDLREKTVIKVFNHPVKLLVNSGKVLYQSARQSQQEGDEEKSYVLYMKFVEVALHVKKTKKLTDEEFDKHFGSNNLENAVKTLEELHSSLNARYSKQEEKKRKVKPESVVKPKQPEENGSEIKENVEKDSANGSSVYYLDSAVSISSLTLRDLIQEGKFSILVLDTRSERDFADSHMCFNNCSMVFSKAESFLDKATIVSVPKEIVKAGLAPSSLEKKLPPESLRSWNQRAEFDLAVLIDWDSYHSSMKSDSSVFILKEIMTKWDINVRYKRNPVVLDGGYYDWVNTFPMMTTNPHVDGPAKPKSLASVIPKQDIYLAHLLSEDDTLDDLDDVVYPSFVDSPPKPVTPSTLNDSSPSMLSASQASVASGPVASKPRLAPVVDRSSKPAAALASPQKSLHSPVPTVKKTTSITPVVSELDRDERPGEISEDKPMSAMANARESSEQATSTAQAPASEILKDRGEPPENRKERPFSPSSEEAEEKRAPKNISIPRVDRSLKAKVLQPAGHPGGDGESSVPPGSLTPPESRKPSITVSKPEDERKEDAKKISVEKVDEGLRKQKPFAGDNDQERKQQQKKMIEKDIWITTLKSEPSPSSSSMKRSRSLQNVSRLIDDQECPKFNRNTKPINKTTDIIATRRRTFDGVYGNVGRGLTGLRNLGNSCYMNSILQCINHTTSLVKYFCDGQYREDVNRSTKLRGEVAEEVAALVRALWSGEYRSIACRDLKGVVGMHKKAFAGHEQQDSHEFLTILMDWLHEDLNRAGHRGAKSGANNSETPVQNASGPEGAMRAWHDFCHQNESLVLHLFYGQQASTVRCLQCGEQSVTYEPFSNLSLPIPPNATRCTLADCMSLYLKGELISGWNCPKCKEPRDASKKFDIWILPRILVIHFKRFTSDGWCRKRQTMVDYPLEDLDVSQWVGTEVLTSGYNPARKRNSALYNLYGVSNHYGTMDGGHYTAYCKSSNFNKWFKFDDHEVSELSPSEVVSPAAYILFYSSVDVS